MQDKTQQIFRDAPVPKAVLTNVIPSIISMLMVLVYNLADTFFIGQTKDPLMPLFPLLHQHLLYSWLSVCYLELVVLL